MPEYAAPTGLVICLGWIFYKDIAPTALVFSLWETRATIGEFDPGYSDPPTYQDLMKIQGAINDIISAID